MRPIGCTASQRASCYSESIVESIYFTKCMVLWSTTEHKGRICYLS